MTAYLDVCESLKARPRRWLVTGAAGFIGSNLVQRLLELGQTVRGLDNLSNGRMSNLDHVKARVEPVAWERFDFVRGDIRDLETCQSACKGMDIVLHQAALGSVPRSLKDPIASHQSNVDGFLNMLVAARDQGVDRMVYASSSSVYGDDPRLPKLEAQTGRPLSPYALTKSIDEQYAAVFAHSYGFKPIGLRYFNVFGPMQDPLGPYAAVIPRWIHALVAGDPCTIFGDGTTSRDFCFVANAVQANILAGTAPDAATGEVYNVSFGGKASIEDLYWLIVERLERARPDFSRRNPVFADPRPGDIRHSQADLAKIKAGLGYDPTHSVEMGLDITVPWFLEHGGSR